MLCSFVGGLVCRHFCNIDEKGYIIVNNDMSTRTKGIYAAGDCIAKDLRQVVTACNDGATAANSIIKALK